MNAGGRKARAAAVVMVALCALGFTGCASAGSAEESTNATVTTQSEAPVAPITPDADPTTAAPEVAADDAEVRFVESVRKGTVGLTDTTDEQWISAGRDACTQMDAGANIDTVDVIQGDSPEEKRVGENDANVANIASELLCPEHVGNFAE